MSDLTQEQLNVAEAVLITLLDELVNAGLPDNKDIIAIDHALQLVRDEKGLF